MGKDICDIKVFMMLYVNDWEAHVTIVLTRMYSYVQLIPI